MALTDQARGMALFNQRATSSSFSNRLFNSVLKVLASDLNHPFTRNAAWGTKAWISRSLSTNKRTATDWTRPADNPGLTLRQRRGDNSNPTRRSRMRRACWAITRSTSIRRGLATALVMAGLVISWKTIRRTLESGRAKTSCKCQAMASPSRSSSDASQTRSELLANFLSSLTMAFLSSGTRYSGA